MVRTPLFERGCSYVTMSTYEKSIACNTIRQLFRFSTGNGRLSNALLYAVYATYKTVPNSVKFLLEMHRRNIVHTLDVILQRWGTCKRHKNYTEADNIRRWLRGHGIEPDARMLVMKNYTSVDDMLDIWQSAKKGKIIYLQIVFVDSSGVSASTRKK